MVRITLLSTSQRKKGHLHFFRVLSRLKELCPHLAPLTVMTDFELAAQNAFGEVFSSNLELLSCFFHFRQANYRNVQGLLL